MIDSAEAASTAKNVDSSLNGLSPEAEKKVEDNDGAEIDKDADFPPDEDVLEMVNDVDLEKPLPTVTDRYFTTYYRIDFPKKGDDICIRIHTNRLCMISVAPSHALFADARKKIAKIDFQVTDKLNRADNAVSGKAKHGAQPLHETSKICTISREDGESWIVRCGMNGKLTEANTDLLENPELLRQPPHKGGYLAIVLPKIAAIEKMKQQLMTQEAYDAAIAERLRGNIENGVGRANGKEAVKRPCDDDNSTSECREKIMRTETKDADESLVSSTLPCT